jgi:hypothetical protein
MILLFIFFLPGFFSFTEFIAFTANGKKPFDGPFGLILDIINIIGFPALYVTFNIPYSSASSLTNAPFFQYTALAVCVCIAAYFIIQFFTSHLSRSVQIIVLIILGAGVFLNVAMIYQEPGIFTYFHIPIILLFIIQIVEKSNALVKVL